MKSKSVTLMDIAKSLDVSVVTVSKALRGHPDISKQTSGFRGASGFGRACAIRL